MILTLKPSSCQWFASSRVQALALASDVFGSGVELCNFAHSIRGGISRNKSLVAEGHLVVQRTNIPFLWGWLASAVLFLNGFEEEEGSGARKAIVPDSLCGNVSKKLAKGESWCLRARCKPVPAKVSADS